jgi:hypothetical protein
VLRDRTSLFEPAGHSARVKQVREHPTSYSARESGINYGRRLR